MTRLDEAWQALRRGDLPRAEAASVEAITKGGTAPDRTPLLRVWLAQAGFQRAAGNDHAAFEMLYRCLDVFPASEVALDQFIGLVAGRRIDTHNLRFAMPPADTQGNLVFGLGTGRSGSTTLTHLLMQQKGVYAAHEHRPLLPWEGGEQTVRWHMTRMLLLARRYSVVADVSHWWLPYVEEIEKLAPAARFVGLRRDKAETVASFLKIKGGGRPGSINHWMEHDGVAFRRNPWDVCYPSYAASSVEEAIGLYWDGYYRLFEEKAAARPDRMRLFDISELATETGREGILRFCGVPDPTAGTAAQLNEGGVQDGVALRENPFVKA